MAYDRYVGDHTTSTLTMVVGGTVSLAGGTATMLLTRPDGTTLIKSASLDAGARTVAYTWESGVLDQRGQWTAQGKVSVGGGIVHTDPTFVNVGPAAA